MKTQEIITQNNIQGEAILLEAIADKLKSLYIYYKRLYLQEPIFMATCVTNACCYGRIVSPENIDEIVREEAENNEDEIATIYFNSKFLKDIIKHNELIDAMDKIRELSK